MFHSELLNANAQRMTEQRVREAQHVREAVRARTRERARRRRRRREGEPRWWRLRPYDRAA